MCFWDPLLFVWTELTIREFKQSEGRREGVGEINQDGFSFRTWMLTLSYYACTGTGSAQNYFTSIIHHLIYWASRLPKRKHTHIHTHMNVHPYVRTHTPTHSNVHTYIQMCTMHHTHVQTYTYTSMHAFTHGDTRARTNARTHTGMHTRIGTHTYTWGTHAHTDIASLFTPQNITSKGFFGVWLSWTGQTPKNSGIVMISMRWMIQCNGYHLGDTWYIPDPMPGILYGICQPLYLFLPPPFLLFSFFLCVCFFLFLFPHLTSNRWLRSLCKTSAQYWQNKPSPLYFLPCNQSVSHNGCEQWQGGPASPNFTCS